MEEAGCNACEGTRRLGRRRFFRLLAYAKLWTPTLVSEMRDLVARGTVQIDNRVLRVATDTGFPTMLMWNGTLGDATVESPQQIVALAERWIQQGSIVLGHLNHPGVLSVLPQLQEIVSFRGLAFATLDELFGTSRPAL